jgi:sulfate adenylyltransferase subunit 2
MLNGQICIGENVRVFPISNWTEFDVWNYIREEGLNIPSLYFSHERNIIERDGMYWPYSDFLNTSADEVPYKAMVRFRTVGDMTCTAAVLSEAKEIDHVIDEILAATISERGARMDDRRSEAAMEKRKKEGYF